MDIRDELAAIVGHLGAARAQRIDSDDAIIAEHIDEAHARAAAVLVHLHREGRDGTAIV